MEHTQTQEEHTQTQEALFDAIRRIVREADCAPLPPELDPYFRRYVMLPGGDPQRFAACRVRSMNQQAALRELAARFREEAIRFCPIKGADLAWRVWPESIIRCQSDLDLWIHPEDFPKAIEAARRMGWEAPYSYRNDHHAPVMTRRGVSLELHYRLPFSETVPQTGLWAELTPAGESEWRLPPELNLLMLFHHSRRHHWNGLVKLLLDSAFLVAREGAPDWARMNGLAARLRIAGPEMVFLAFPELFPAAAIPAASVPAEALATFRSLAAIVPCGRERAAERVMSDIDRFSLAWWKDRLRGLSPAGVRLTTRNPRGHYGRLALDWCRVFCRKWGWFWRWRHGTEDGELRRRLEAERRLETFFMERDF